MKLFKYRYNKDKDRLIKTFDIDTYSYYYTKYVCGEKIKIDNSELDRKTQKELFRENKKLLEDKELLQQEISRYNETQRRLYLESIGFPCYSFEHLGEVKGSMSDDMGTFLKELLEEENTLLGIHRVGAGFTEHDVTNCFLNGVKIMGHMGVTSYEKELGNTVSYYPNNNTIVKELMYASDYKNSVGSLLFRFPDEALEENSDIIIYNNDDLVVNPKYIVGYVPLYENHHIENIIYNPNYGLDFINIKKSG